MPPSATSVPAVRKCASGSSSSAISGARSSAGVAGVPERGRRERDRAGERVGGVGVEPVVWRGGDGVDGHAVGAPLPSAALGEHPNAFGNGREHGELAPRRPCRRSARRTPGSRRWPGAVRRWRAPTTTPRPGCARSPFAHVVLVEVHEPVRRHHARRQPGVHDLVDAVETFGRPPVSAAATSASVANSQSSGSAATPSSSSPSIRPSARRPVPVTTALRPVMGRTARRACDQTSMMAPPSAIRVWPVM